MQVQWVAHDRCGTTRINRLMGVARPPVGNGKEAVQMLEQMKEMKQQRGTGLQSRTGHYFWGVREIAGLLGGQRRRLVIGHPRVCCRSLVRIAAPSCLTDLTPFDLLKCQCHHAPSPRASFVFASPCALLTPFCFISLQLPLPAWPACNPALAVELHRNHAWRS